MSSDSRIEFRKFRPLPPPWEVVAEEGNTAPCIETPFTLRRLPLLERTEKGRAAVRAALTMELQRAAQRRVRWCESPTGPKVLERIRDTPVGVSISYGRTGAWLALGWEGPIGVDTAAIEKVPDWEEVALAYMGRSALERLRKSPEPELDFALEWAAFEARLKLAGLSLGEGIEPPRARIYAARLGSQAVAVAIEPRDPKSTPQLESARSGRCFVP
jgi:phosphopantetheinyl transferase